MINLCFQVGDDRNRTCTDVLLISRSDYKVDRKAVSTENKQTNQPNGRPTNKSPYCDEETLMRKQNPQNIFKGLLIFSSKAVV